MDLRSMVTSVTQMYEESGGRAAPVLADRYRLIAQLGRGGTARVIRAWDERLAREVAIKIFQPHADPVGRLRFEEEARLLAGFDHPGLVKVFDSGYAHGEPFLVLELIDGPHLGRRIDDAAPLGVDETRQLGEELAEALAYVHSHGVVHRDLKPGNVLLDATGRPHLADFGLAKLLARSGITASDRLVGTAAYLSPEQVLGTEVGPPADIYALGLLLLECLTGEVEYPGLDAETVLARISRRPRIPVGVPSSFAEALELMTRNEPKERPSAIECVALLGSDRPTTPIVRSRRFSRVAAVALIGAGLGAGAVGLWAVSPTSVPTHEEQQVPHHGQGVDSTLGQVVIPSQLPPGTAGGQQQGARREQPQVVADQKSSTTLTVTENAPVAPAVTQTQTQTQTVDPGQAADHAGGPTDRAKGPKKSRTESTSPHPG